MLLFMHIPYLMFVNQDSFLSQQALDRLAQAKEVHLVHFDENIFQYRQNEQQFYQYCFTLKEMQEALLHGVIPHLAFRGKSISDSELLHVPGEFERFWFIDETVIGQDVQFYSEYFEDYPYALCLSISPVFQPNIDIQSYEIYRQWIANFYSQTHNSMALKETDLLQSEQFHELNHIVIQKDNEISEHTIILGLFGDCPVENLEHYYSINLKTMMRQKDCSDCDYQPYCLERGLGYLMHEFKLKGCMGIQLLHRS